MNRYINANELYDELGRCIENGDAFGIVAETLDVVRRRIMGFPTADVAPIIHAHWTRVNDAENVYMCDGKDGCGRCIQVTRGTPIDNDLGFCPNCGAKMDEEAMAE